MGRRIIINIDKIEAMIKMVFLINAVIFIRLIIHTSKVRFPARSVQPGMQHDYN